MSGLKTRITALHHPKYQKCSAIATITLFLPQKITATLLSKWQLQIMYGFLKQENLSFDLVTSEQFSNVYLLDYCLCGWSNSFSLL